MPTHIRISQNSCQAFHYCWRRIVLCWRQLKTWISVFSSWIYNLSNNSKHNEKASNQHRTRIFNCWSPSDNETHSLIVAYVFPLTIVINFNIWLKVILRHTNINADNLCNGTEQVKSDIITMLEFSFIGMMYSFLIIEAVIGMIFIFACCHPHSKNPFKLILPTCTKRNTRV